MELERDGFDTDMLMLCALIGDLLAALSYIHEGGGTHKDIKPANVLMSKEGRPVLADLGVASPGTIKEGIVKAALRGCTPVYASPHVRRQ